MDAYRSTPADDEIVDAWVGWRHVRLSLEADSVILQSHGGGDHVVVVRTDNLAADLDRALLRLVVVAERARSNGLHRPARRSPSHRP